MKKIISLLFFLFSLSAIFAQPVAKYDSKTNKYGIKDEKTKKWLSLPVYNGVQTVSSGDTLRYFLAKKGNSKIIISKNGKTPLSPFFDDITVLSADEPLFIVKTKTGHLLFEEGKGVLKNIPPFTSWQQIDYSKGYYKLLRNNAFFLFNARERSYNPTPYAAIEGFIPRTGTEDFFTAKKQKWGLIGFLGNEIVPCIYDSISYTANLLKTKKGALWGIVDTSGNTSLDFLYDDINLQYTLVFSDFFSMNFLPVKRNKKWGVINNSGQILIPFLYDEFRGLNNKNQIIVIKDGKMGIIDSAGKEVFPFIYTYFERIDKDFYLPTKEKLLLVNNGCTDCNADISGGKWGIADSAGKIILEPNASIIKIKGPSVYYNNPEMNGSEDSVFISYLWNIGGNKIPFVLDSSNTETFDEKGDPTGNVIYVPRYGYNIRGGKTGIADRNGKFILPPAFDKLGFCYLLRADGDVQDCLNEFTDNSKKTENIYRVDTSFLIIAVKEKKFGVYDWKGKEIIPCTYDSISYEYTSYDATDSVFRTNNFPKRFFSFYKGKLRGYVDLNGKILVPASIEEELRTISFVNYDSLLLNDNYNPDYYQEKQYRVVLNTGQAKKFLVESTVNPEYGYESAFTDAPRVDTFKLFNRGNFNFLDIAGIKLVGNTWIEDAILLSKNFGAISITEQDFQFSFENGHDINSILDLKTGKYIKSRHGYEYGADNKFADNVIIKTGGKWYVKNIFKPELKNKEMGFDSVTVVSLKFFKGYKNGKYSYYSFKETNFNAPEINLEFPDIGIAGPRLVCRNCQYEIKKYPAKKGVALFDIYGNEYDVNGDEPGDSTVFYTMEIPFIKKGQFNFMTEGNTSYVLKTFADEVLLPSPYYDYSFSLTDTNSAVFNEKSWDKGDDWPLFFAYNNSLAVRNGASWTLITLQNPAKTFDGFQKVKYQNNYWYAFKDGKLYIYRADSLAEIPPRILNYTDINLESPIDLGSAVTYFFAKNQNGIALINADGTTQASLNNYEDIDLKNSDNSIFLNKINYSEQINQFVLKYKGKWGLNGLNTVARAKLGISGTDSLPYFEKQNIENPPIKFEYDSIRLATFFDGKIFLAYRNGKPEQFNLTGQKIPALRQVELIAIPYDLMINFTDGNPEGFKINSRLNLLCNNASVTNLNESDVKTAAGNNIDPLAADLIRTKFVTGGTSFMIGSNPSGYFFTDTISFQNIYFIYDVYSETKGYSHIAFAYNPLDQKSYLEFAGLLKTGHEFHLGSIIIQKNNKYAFSTFTDSTGTELKKFIYDSFSLEKADGNTYTPTEWKIKFNIADKEPVYYNLKGEKRE